MSTTAAAVEVLAERSTTTTSVGIIGYIIIGGLAGWIASKILGTDKQMGIGLNIVVGVIGAFLGGFLLSFAFDTRAGDGSSRSSPHCWIGHLLYIVNSSGR